MSDSRETQVIADNLRRNAKARGKTQEDIRKYLELKRLDRFEIDAIMQLIAAKW